MALNRQQGKRQMGKELSINSIAHRERQRSFTPQISCCVRCGKPIAPRTFVGVLNGSVAHWACPEEN